MTRARTDRLSLEEFLPYRLSFTSNLVSEAIAQSYRTLFGIGIPEWRIVAHVAAEPGISQQQIGTRSRMDKVTVSRATLALVQRGLIARTAKASDRRSRHLVLTGDGERLYAEIAPKALALERAVLTGLTADEVTGMKAMLRRIDAAVASLSPDGDGGAGRTPPDRGMEPATPV